MNREPYVFAAAIHLNLFLVIYVFGSFGTRLNKNYFKAKYLNVLTIILSHACLCLIYTTITGTYF